MASPGGNPLLKGLVAQHPTTGHLPTDKGKRPRTEQPSRAKESPENVELITIVLPPPQQQPDPVQETLRPKKRKDREHKRISLPSAHPPNSNRPLLSGTMPWPWISSSIT